MRCNQSASCHYATKLAHWIGVHVCVKLKYLFINCPSLIASRSSVDKSETQYAEFHRKKTVAFFLHWLNANRKRNLSVSVRYSLFFSQYQFKICQKCRERKNPNKLCSIKTEQKPENHKLYGIFKVMKLGKMAPRISSRYCIAFNQKYRSTPIKH